MPPPRDDASLARIRDNQRRSRARRREYLHELEQRVRAYEQLGVEASAEVQHAARRVADENRRLRALLQREHGVSAARIDAYLQAGRAAERTTTATAALDQPLDQPLDQLMGPRFLPAPPGGSLSAAAGSPGGGGGDDGSAGGAGGGSSEDDDAAGGTASALSTDDSAGGGGRRRGVSSSRGHGPHGHRGHRGHRGHHGHHGPGSSERGRKTKRGAAASASPSFPGVAAVPSPPVGYASSSSLAASFSPAPFLVSSYGSSSYDTLDAGGGGGEVGEADLGRQQQQQPSPLQPYAPVDPLFFDYGLGPPYSGAAQPDTCPTCMAGLVCSLHGGYYEG